MPSVQVKSNIMLLENEVSMSEKYAKTLLVISFFLLIAMWGGKASAEIIFEEDFDGQADWMPVDNNESCNNVSTTCDGSPPANWSYFRSTEDWHPGEAAYASKQPSQQISNRQFMGASGKSWVRYHESSETNQSTFGDDALLLKHLDAEYDDVYVSFWIKMDPNWKWVSTGSAKLKLVRVFHFDGPDGTANPWDYFSDGDSGPIFIMDLKLSNKWGFRSTYSARCDPQMSDYYCNPSRDWEGDSLWVGAPTFEESLGDGGWHQIQVRVKMNSSLGAKDGIFSVWLDGVLQYSFNNVPWREAGSSESIGWNMIGIGGNTTNWFSDPSNEAEQWYAIDNLIVSTKKQPYEQLAVPGQMSCFELDKPC